MLRGAPSARFCARLSQSRLVRASQIRFYHEAHERWFIANSMTFLLSCEPSVMVKRRRLGHCQRQRRNRYRRERRRPLERRRISRPEEAGAAATEYLRLFGLVALGFMWARSAVIVVEKVARPDSDAAFYKAKLTTPCFSWSVSFRRSAAARRHQGRQGGNDGYGRSRVLIRCLHRPRVASIAAVALRRPAFLGQAP